MKNVGISEKGKKEEIDENSNSCNSFREKLSVNSNDLITLNNKIDKVEKNSLVKIEESCNSLNSLSEKLDVQTNGLITLRDKMEKSEKNL